jgi:hypothetical protein
MVCDAARRMIHTERLLIEPLAHEHAVGLVAALHDERVGEFIGGPDVTTVEVLHERIDRLAGGPGLDWPIEHWHNWVARRADDRVIVGVGRLRVRADRRR